MASQKRQTPNEGLSKRAVEILGLLAEGMSDREISEQLVMTINTVKWYNRQIYSILGVGSRTQAIARARELQLLDQDSDAAPAFPAVRSPSKNNLPVETTRFIGRNLERAEIKRLLESTHLLTLVGSPGTGKTRLALQIAWEVADGFQEGAFFISLAPITDPALVMDTIACAIGVQESAEQPLLETLKLVLRESQMLLVLDNFEHLLSAAPQISELLSAAPQLKIVATSREPLHLYGEQEYAVPPLALPDLDQLDLQILAECESTALFIQKARAVRSNFVLTPENALDIAKICVRLEGLPLAIELAAARIKLLSPKTLLERLVNRLDTLTGGAQDLPARQRTLLNTIEWSYNLLNEADKMLFARLSVFRGGFSLEAAEAVCSKELAVNIFDGLESLVNKSLIQQTELSTGEPRFYMLETLHEYAWERLRTDALWAEIGDRVAGRHSAFFLALVTGCEAALFGREPQAAVTTIRHDMDNIRQAWQWAVEHAAAEPRGAAPFHRAIDALAAFYEVASLFEEGQVVFVHALENMAQDRPEAEAIRCHLLVRVAEFAEWRGEREHAYLAATQAVQLAERLNLPLYRADGLRILGILGRERGTTEQAISQLQEAIKLYRSLGAKRPLATACDWLGLLCSDLSRVDEAMDYLGQAAALYAELGNERGIVFNKGMTAIVLSVVGRLEESLAYQREVLAGYKKLEYPVGVARTANNLGLVLLELGQLEEAVTQLEHAVQIYQQTGNTAGIYNSMGNKGEVHLALEDYKEAGRCFQLAGQSFHESGLTLLESENFWRLGLLLIQTGEFEQARAALEAGLALAPAEENPEAFAMAHSLLAEIERQSGNLEQALARFDLAAEAFKMVRRHITVARFAIIPRAAMLLEMGEVTAAEEALSHVWPLLDEAGGNPIIYESRLLQAKIMAAQGDHLGARQQLERLLSNNLRPGGQAAVCYELWQLTKDKNYGRQTLDLYQQLAAHSPNITYRSRLTDLNAAALVPC